MYEHYVLVMNLYILLLRYILYILLLTSYSFQTNRSLLNANGEHKY